MFGCELSFLISIIWYLCLVVFSSLRVLSLFFFFFVARAAVVMISFSLFLFYFACRSNLGREIKLPLWHASYPSIDRSKKIKHGNGSCFFSLFSLCSNGKRALCYGFGFSTTYIFSLYFSVYYLPSLSSESWFECREYESFIDFQNLFFLILSKWTCTW